MFSPSWSVEAICDADLRPSSLLRSLGVLTPPATRTAPRRASTGTTTGLSGGGWGSILATRKSHRSQRRKGMACHVGGTGPVVAEIGLFSTVLKREKWGENAGLGTVRILDRLTRLFSLVC